ncbi:class I SAM-dependent methyltransferase [Neobacillus sp. 114]|uniref:class I SAM-dependent methyltransferase n=1 Tax=Neobacillus sp. 114 TaxID=3048535 RepID=UPI0024C3C6A8|nr:class I SAM-dependent methyltransferase [Neobacillus sp. 114]
MADAKNTVQQQFAKNPEKYRDEKLFAAGQELDVMVKAVTLTGEENVLDIGTAAGHTALAFAPFVKKCMGVDITEEMVKVATDYAKERGCENVTFQQADAESLPFPDAMFDIVTCRYAAHHFPNVRKAVKEISRVLKKGGHFLLVDHYAPEDKVLDHFINTVNKLRDPSQVRESSLSEWREMFVENSLYYSERLKWNLPLEYASWIERAGTSADAQKKILSILENATPICRDTFQITFNEEGVPQDFCLKAVLLHGVKGE